MLLYKVKNAEEMGYKAGEIIEAQVILKPNCILGLATGSTPIGAYRYLAEEYEKGKVDFSEVSSINLDEYVGLSGQDSQSYRYFMKEQLFDHINIDQNRTYVPDGLADSPLDACEGYDKIIKESGGVDLQLLGIGGNGHIGFNEPADSFIKETHVVTLTEDTRRANARFFDSMEQVPTHAITMGMGGIMSARKILLMASGKGKAKALFDAFYGPISPEVPASILQLHPDVTVVADEDALSLVK